MKFAILRKTALATVAAIGILALGQEEASARWWGGSSSSSSSSSGSYGSSSSSSSSGGWGHHRSYHSSHYAYYSGSSSSSSSGGWGSSSSSSSSTSWGSYGSSSSSSSGGWSYSYPTYRVAPAPAASGDAPAPPAAGGDDMTRYHPGYGSNAASLAVKVPTDAKVFVNGNATSSEGANRRYVSRNLSPGQSYTYQVRAEVVRDGKTLTETKSVKITAGGVASLDFQFNSDQPAEQVADTKVETKLTVKVPAEAKVFLAGRETKQSGAVREFTTTALPSGSEWENYTVRVVVEQDGKPQSQEQTIRLKSGEDRELEFNFAGAGRVAANR
jgi:uncharacterized protein (TIGR03000 family)